VAQISVPHSHPVAGSSPVTSANRFSFGRLPVAFRLSYEQLAWGVVLVAAILTRFWDLGSRAMHHDESLHAWFSYNYAIGKGYAHDPLLHGPFLYHLGALIDVLFGATEATARYGPALFGVILVMLPFLLRPVIGRWGALICALMLLVNPGVLYYSRLIRQDIYMMVFVLTFIIAIARYVYAPAPRWVFLGAVDLALMHTTHEVTYIVALLFGAFFFIIITIRAAKAVLAATGVYLLVAGLTAVALPKLLHAPALPEIPWDASKGELDVAHWKPYLQTLLSAPQVVALLALTALYLTAAGYILTALHAREVKPGTTPNDRLFGGWPQGSLIDVVHTLIADKRTLGVAAGGAVFIWVILYTSLFTNLSGVFSGAAYSLIYWAGQHDVHRGGQPFYYYLFLFPLSGPLSCFFGLGASAITVSRFANYLGRRRAITPRFFTQIMLVWYGTGMFFALSWAGERMPWLVCHLIVPFSVLVASVLGEAVEYLTARWREAANQPDGLVLALAPVRSVRPAGAFGIVANPPVTLGTSGVRVSDRVRDLSVLSLAVLFVVSWFFSLNRVTENPRGDIRFLFLVGPLALIAGFTLYGLRNGARRAWSLAALAVALPLLLLELHLGWHLSYAGGDVPTDMLVYTQTAPDIARMQGEINILSRQTTGNDHGLVIMDSTSTVWPMNWYLRDYITAGNIRSFGGAAAGQPQLTEPPKDDVALVMVGNDEFGAWEDQQLTNYQRTDYVMRWWFPEEFYRAFTYSPDSPRPDYPGLWTTGLIPEHIDPTTGQLVPAKTGDVPPTWGDTIAKAISSIIALGSGSTTVTQATTLPNGEVGKPEEKVTPAPTSLLWRYFALREPPQTVGSFNFHLYVRNDLVPAFNGIRY